MSPETRVCQNCKTDFVIEPDDFAFYEKIQVPPPTFCPACRFQRRLMFRNERSLYRGTCKKCGKAIITMYAPGSPHNVYCLPCYVSDDWNPFDYGKDYDPSRPFFEQFQNVLESTPVRALSAMHSTLVNSEYVNEASYLKNCYLVFNADFCENSNYGSTLSNTKDVMDALILGESELCYEVVNCEKCFNVFFSEDVTDSHDIYFSKNLVGCGDCFGCANLRNKNYHIWNEPYSKEDYAKKLAELKEHMGNALTLPNLIEESELFWQKSPQKFMHGLQNTNVSGDYVYHSKNAKEMYQARYAEDSKYCQLLKDPTTKDAYDYTVWGMNAERVYEAITCGHGVSNVKFCATCISGSHDVEYSFFCESSSNLFGCVSLGKRQYCILNKQYSKEEYEALRDRIIEDMNAHPYTDAEGRVWRYGEFFPYSLCPFSYNETLAGEYFPVSEEEATRSGWKWHKASPNEYAITRKGSELSPYANDVSEGLLKEVVECMTCKRAYKLTQPEIELLKRFGFPAPRHCADCRHRRRFARLNPPKLWKRNCKQCGKEVATSYAPDRPEIVYCAECYQAEVM